ncbi:MAG: hypothetical protein NC041_02890 [Bacteroides sp.]|nr:hypothetical protein [Prevotella sp.]MCM1408438.1 hypothetical protein [Treponema brennaborense]MCM1469400.1 hypothetical protein [Bacteroides sp.]
MVGFWLKKNFWDGWENALILFLCNIGIYVSAAAAFFGYSGICALLDMSAAAWMTPAVKNFAAMCAVVVFMAVGAIVPFAANECLNQIADFKSVKMRDFFSAFPAVWSTALRFGAFYGAVVVLFMNAFPFYLRLWRGGSMFALLLGAVVFWSGAVCFLSLQWFMPLYARMKGGFLKNLKKCFILFFDNTNFTLGMCAYNIVLAVFSIFLVFLLPGAAGIFLACNNALRLRLYKYDWIEENPNLTPKQMKKDIPWAALTAEDRESLGPRDFRSFLFPWK